METKTGAVAVCTAVVVVVAVLVGGPVACDMEAERQHTERVRAACHGDLAADAARAVACTLALTRRGTF